MGRAATLSTTVSTGNVLANGNNSLSDPKIFLGGSQGSAGQALLSAGAGNTPAWGDVASGLTLLQVHTFSGSLTKDIENFSSAYDDYLFIYKYTPASNGACSCLLKVGGSYLTTSTYRMHVSKLSSASASYAAWNTSALPYITLSGANTCSAGATANNVFMIQALNVNNSAKYPKIQWQGTIDDGTNLLMVNGSADIPTAGAFGGIRFIVNDGSTINVGGTVSVYGYKKST